MITAMIVLQQYVPCLDSICSGKGLKTGVNFDSREDSVLLQEVNEGGSLSRTLEKSLLVKNGARDIVAKSGSREEKTYVINKYQKLCDVDIYQVAWM